MQAPPARPLPRPTRARGRLVVLLGAVVATVAGALVGVVAPLAVAPTVAPASAATDFGAPSWWDGDCDTNNWTRKARSAGWTGAAASRLGGVVLGIPVCGPRALAGAPNIWWSRAGWGELEWQCVEFAQRFMIQVYGVSPYQANGVEVVNHYTSAQGGGLIRVDNGTVGRAPQPGDVMSFSSPTNRYGHVAVVASTSVDGSGNGTVRLATQNDTADGWRTLTVKNWVTQAFGSLYPYAWLHDPQGRGGGPTDGGGSDDSLREGSFIQFGVTTYRIAGGAPVVVTTWPAMGAVSPVVVVDAARFATLRAVPRDGTFLRAATGTAARWRVAGGAPLPVTDCDAVGMSGCAGSVDIDPAAVGNIGLGGTFSHLRATVSDGTFLRVGDDGAPGLGTLGRAAGGAVLPVADCDTLGGCNDWVTVQRSTWTAYRAAHPNPVDGTVLRLQPSGTYVTYGGGRCAVGGASATSWTDVPDRAVSCGTTLTGASPTPATLVRDRPVATRFSATGGTAPYRYDVVAGQEPTGTTLAADGMLSGTPDTSAAFSFTVRTTDAAGASVTSALTWRVAAPVAVTTKAVPTLTVGAPVSIALQARGGASSYLWSAVSSLPEGLALTADGVLSGTPTAEGSRAVRVRAVDSGSTSYGDTARFTVVVGR